MTADLKTGPEMDRAVAEAVGGNWSFEPEYNCILEFRPDYDVPRHPSSNISDAIAALEATGVEWCIAHERPEDTDIESYYEVEIDVTKDDEETIVVAVGITLPKAACRALLAWHKAKEGA